MDLKKLCRALLFPHTALMLLLIPTASAFLVFSMIFFGTESPISAISYALAAYTLTIWCLKIPHLVECIRVFKKENKYIRLWQSDSRLRVKVLLYSALVWNTLYGIFQLWLGLYNQTFWYLSLGAYYICLALMRFFLLLHTRKYAPGEQMRTELIKYRACGWIFLVMNLALMLITFFMLYWGRTFTHHMITAIAIAAYTFTAFPIAVLNTVKYKKYRSPVFSASVAISFAAACVSMLTLTSTLLTAFGNGSMDASAQRVMLGSVGVAVSTIVVLMAVYMIVKGTRELRQYKTEVENGEQK